ncbi:hypothetical protein A9Q98_14910 [Thalassotalea sp. 42_200_T64]|mgnify:CR=1 FL=1|nr:hypothetical protein A9Q98_14910 [Thalassotalea sp. 42_200_T64]
MSAVISFFPVGNGDMTLIKTNTGKNILIDCNIRQGDDFPDVVEQLRNKLSKDSDGRLFIDLFVWSHPDLDHCRGIKEEFHLGKPDDWNENKDKIFINEIWSSPMVYRRASKNHKLSDDAKALNKEIKRRVNVFKDACEASIGNQVLILGDDENGKTDDIQDIVLALDSSTSYINSKHDSSFEAKLLGPAPVSELDDDEENLSKNKSSAIINYTLTAGDKSANFLSGGDAEVACWEALLKRMKDNKTESDLEYDILQAPHHCSWHSLSHDSLSEAKENGTEAKISDDAVEALGKANDKAFIVSSSEAIKNDDKNPPAFKAKQEYVKILNDVSGSFNCVADHKKNKKNVPLEIEISSNGIKTKAIASLASSSNATQSAVNRNGGDGYA